MVDKLSDEEIAAAEMYAKFAFDLWHSVMQDHTKWEEIADQEKSAWMHMIIGLRDVGSNPANHVKLNVESAMSLETILSPYRGQIMGQEQLKEAHQLIHDWVKERCLAELKEDESFEDLIDVEIVVMGNKLSPRFVGHNDRGHQILRKLFT